MLNLSLKMRITADVIDEEPCIECSDFEQEPPKCEKRLRLVVKGNSMAKAARQYRFMFNTMLKKFKQLDVSDSFLPISGTAANRKLFRENNQTDAMASKDSASASGTQNVDQEWLAEELSKMKKEITKDVTKNVMQHLMGALRSTQDNITKEVDDSSIHKGIYCDNCDQIICGVRYKCGNCSDYDLCEVCENIPDVHDGNHIFLKIRNPMPQQSKPKRRRKKVVKTPVYTSCGDMHVTIDVAASKTALGKLAADRYKMNAKFIQDVTIPDGSCVTPGSQFLKSWVVMNSGNRPWTHETSINYMSGSSLMKPFMRKVEVPKLLPGEEGIVSVMFTAPVIPGTYQSHWGFVHKDEETFGDRIWCIVEVVPSSNAPYPALGSSVEQTNLASKMFADDSSDDLNNGSFLVCKGNEAKESVDDADKESLSGKKQALEEAGIKQSDPNVSHVAEVLTAVHEVQERGELVSRKLAASSYTATPNNTPFDLSPPKSPEPQDLGSKDVQLSAVGDMAGTLSTQEKPNKTVISGAGVENEDKSCISLSSSESDAEFVVIPMPKCFTFGEMLPAEIIQPIVPERDLQAGGFTEVKLDENVMNASAISGQNAKNSETESALFAAEPSEESTVVDETRSLSIETTVKLIKTDCIDSKIGKAVISQYRVDCSSPEFSVIDSEAQTPEVEVLTPEVEIATPDFGEEQSVHVESSTTVNCSVECLPTPEPTTDEQRESELQHQDDLESSGTYPKVPVSTASAEQTTPRLEERTIQVLPEGLVTGALSAAATVYNTARAVISSIQNQETEGPQPESTPVPSHIATMDPMQQLIEMGFCNRPKNEQLLQQHNGDVALVVAQLVSMNDNDWYASRHSVGSGMADFD